MGGAVTIHCNALQHTAPRYNTLPTLQHWPWGGRWGTRWQQGSDGANGTSALRLTDPSMERDRKRERERERERERSKRRCTRSLQRLRASRCFFKSRMPPGAPRPPRTQLSIGRRRVCVLSVRNAPHLVPTTPTTHTCLVGLIVCLVRWGRLGGKGGAGNEVVRSQVVFHL